MYLSPLIFHYEQREENSSLEISFADNQVRHL